MKAPAGVRKSNLAHKHIDIANCEHAHHSYRSSVSTVVCFDVVLHISPHGTHRRRHPRDTARSAEIGSLRDTFFSLTGTKAIQAIEGRNVGGEEGSGRTAPWATEKQHLGPPATTPSTPPSPTAQPRNSCRPVDFPSVERCLQPNTTVYEATEAIK